MAATDGDPPYTQPTRGFGPVEDADSTRQAQHAVANDAPVDVNPNAILARAQGETIVLMGKNFEAGAARRNGLLDMLMGKAVA